MKYQSIFVMSLICHPLYAWASSCPANQQLSLIHTANMYANSVIWLNRAEQAVPFTANTTSQTVRFSSSKLDVAPNIIKYTPQRHFQALQDYQITAPEMKNMGLNPDNYQFYVQKEIELAPLQWFKKPQFLGYEIQKNDPQFGESGQLFFSLQSNLNPEDYMVLVHVGHNSAMTEPKSFIIQPFAEPQQHNAKLAQISFGFSPCQSEIYFQEHQQMWLKFDLISHDGQLNPWQGEPIKILIQTASPTPKHPAPSTTLWIQFKTWLSSIWKKLFASSV